MMNGLAHKWREDRVFAVLAGWRNELYPIYYPTSEMYFLLERAACSLFGLVTYGVHMIAYIPATAIAPLRMWIPRRARAKSTYPGMLDNTVAGGIGYPYGVYETLIKECGEEAGYSEELVRTHAKAVGTVSYFYERSKAAGGESGYLQPEVQYCYDLEVSEDTPVPQPVDGEAEAFYLWDVEKVKLELAAGNFKPNTALGTLKWFHTLFCGV